MQRTFHQNKTEHPGLAWSLFLLGLLLLPTMSVAGKTDEEERGAAAHGAGDGGAAAAASQTSLDELHPTIAGLRTHLAEQTILSPDFLAYLAAEWPHANQASLEEALRSDLFFDCLSDICKQPCEGALTEQRRKGIDVWDSTLREIAVAIAGTDGPAKGATRTEILLYNERLRGLQVAIARNFAPLYTGFLTPEFCTVDFFMAQRVVWSSSDFLKSLRGAIQWRIENPGERPFAKKPTDA